jgi:hypothetical protein
VGIPPIWWNIICTFGLFSKIGKNNPDVPKIEKNNPYFRVGRNREEYTDTKTEPPVFIVAVLSEKSFPGDRTVITVSTTRTVDADITPEQKMKIAIRLVKESGLGKNLDPFKQHPSCAT